MTLNPIHQKLCVHPDDFCRHANLMTSRACAPPAQPRHFVFYVMQFDLRAFRAFNAGSAIRGVVSAHTIDLFLHAPPLPL
jgi:hypothetical protein